MMCTSSIKLPFVHRSSLIGDQQPESESPKYTPTEYDAPSKRPSLLNSRSYGFPRFKHRRRRKANYSNPSLAQFSSESNGTRGRISVAVGHCSNGQYPGQPLPLFPWSRCAFALLKVHLFTGGLIPSTLLEHYGGTLSVAGVWF